MILDQISNLPLYLPLHSQFPAVLQFLRTRDLESLAPGRYEVDGHGAFALVSEYETRPLSECFIECHRKYIDIQMLLRGSEGVGFCHRSSGRELPYDEERDFLKLEAKTDILTFVPGAFFIFFPDDGHMPTIRLGQLPSPVKKVVFKVPVDPS